MKRAKEIPSRVTVHVPLKFATRGGRKTILQPASESSQPPEAGQNNALITAVARAHRWRKLIEDGEYASITELAYAKGVNQSYACRLLRITLLSPLITQCVLDGRCSTLTLNKLMRPLPIKWADQKALFNL